MSCISRHLAVTAIVITFSAVLASMPLADTNVLQGEMRSYIDGVNHHAFEFRDTGGGLVFIKMETFELLDYESDPVVQQVHYADYGYSPEVTSWDTLRDEDGNLRRVSCWGTSTSVFVDSSLVPGVYEINVAFELTRKAILDGMQSRAPFPVYQGSLPLEVERYIGPGPYTECDDPCIVSLADSLTKDCKLQHQAVTRILDWCVDGLQYAPKSPRSASWICNNRRHRCNCQGASHIAIAMLRSLRIPARYVVGITVMGTYYVPTDSAGHVVKHTCDPHAWLEVYYPDTQRWIPYDPRGFYHYVDTYRCRLGIGVDAKRRVPARVSYRYFDPPPSYRWMSYHPSTIEQDENRFRHKATLPTPSGRVCSDFAVSSE
jgi:transglutaminase-like putative cysteine protease